MSDGSSFALWMIDAGATYFINSFAGKSGLVDATMKFISFAGVPIMVLLVASHWWTWNQRYHTRFVAVSAGLSVLLALGLNQVVLLIVHRIRPYDAGVTHLLIPPSVDPSFPSDHASVGFAIAFALLFRGKTRMGNMFAFAAALVAQSRVFLGIHYVGDVLGGMVTALFAVIAVYVFYAENGYVNQKVTKIL
jgi:undecaprenyl-diphosphatase